jgi:hypothetical protein
MSKHTPGPWRIDPIRPDRVLSLDDAVCDCEWYSFSRNRDQANARFIAAAPDMYEALLCISKMAGLTLLGGSGLDPEKAYQLGAHNAFEQATEVANVALTKANGEIP